MQVITFSPSTIETFSIKLEINLVLINGYPKTQKLLLDEGNELNLFNGSELCIKAEGGPTCLTRAILRN